MTPEDRIRRELSLPRSAWEKLDQIRRLTRWQTRGWVVEQLIMRWPDDAPALDSEETDDE